ncbi:DNA-binding domain-containing protein [Vibrio variabilis]|uniref:HvfC/BufC N-terminal domain-containing protein n=1 Tax=Vibrio variabilis TaxID=990271 RepID=UPI000DD51ECE|nr:DNA-binding domain-containing protein [Vibrio variabilis]
MISLQELQSTFSQSLRSRNSNIESYIVADHFSADDRIQIYRNNFVFSLSEVLEACYPITLQLVGEECFQSMAKHHVIHHPPTTGNVADYGKGFAESVSELNNITNAVPYLVDVMKLEWAIDSLNQRPLNKAEAPIEPIVNMQLVPEAQHGNLVFHVKPNHTVLQSQFAIANLVNAIHSNNLEGFEINQPENVLIIKQGLATSTLHVLEDNVLELLNALNSQQPLKFIDPALLTALPSLFALDVVAGFTLHDDTSQGA